MHILTVPEPLDPTFPGPFKPGEYLVEDRNGAEIMLMTPGATMKPYGPQGQYRINPEWMAMPSQAILIIAPLGFGDSILLTPCLRAIKQLHPSATLALAVLHERRQPFLGLPYVDGFEDYPLRTEHLSKYDCVLSLERSVENNPKARVQHMTDRFAEHLGLAELKDRTVDYIVSQAELDWVKASFPRGKKRRIGVQVQAAARCRSYPKMTLLIEALRRAGWEVGLLGRPGEFRTDGPKNPDVIDLSRRGLTWRQSEAFLLTCDVFLGPDSSLLHAAGALNVPAVGLFGPFPWKLRTAYYKSVHAIQGHEGCDIAPCFHSQHLGMPPFPLNGPCIQTGKCHVLDSILPKRIIAKIEQVAAKPT